jgi:hypothetical protein
MSPFLGSGRSVAVLLIIALQVPLTKRFTGISGRRV